MEQADTLLEQLDDPPRHAFRERCGGHESHGTLQNLLNARNDSLLAHGVSPIGEEKARRLQGQIRELAAACDPAITNEWLPKAAIVRFKEL